MLASNRLCPVPTDDGGVCGSVPPPRNNLPLPQTHSGLFFCRECKSRLEAAATFFCVVLPMYYVKGRFARGAKQQQACGREAEMASLQNEAQINPVPIIIIMPAHNSSVRASGRHNFNSTLPQYAGLPSAQRICLSHLVKLGAALNYGTLWERLVGHWHHSALPLCTVYSIWHFP